MQLDAIILPDDLIWVDELEWTPVQQSEAYTLTGALVLETGVKQAGRPITLQGDGESAWITRATLLSLYAKLTAAPPYTLTLNDARTFSVAFRHGQAPIQAQPVIDYNTPADADYYSGLTLRLMEL